MEAIQNINQAQQQSSQQSGAAKNSSIVSPDNTVLNTSNSSSGNISTAPFQQMLTLSSQEEEIPVGDSETVVELSPNGRYAKLNKILGKGAYKIVWKAIDRDEGFEVAWNCFQTSKSEYSELSQEIEILKNVQHPNIINFHDSWYNGNNELIFITELMTSGTLREYIRKIRKPNIKIIKRWCRQILKGLSYLHNHHPPIIHRDIKCDNIFINGAHGEVKIGDMGTAKMKSGKKYTVIGTPEFMAPEMYEEKGYNEKVDVYAFGMCLLEMVTGEYPYCECKNAAQVYKKVSLGHKPDCLSKVEDSDALALINACIATEDQRCSVQEALDSNFLAVEPEVICLSSSDKTGIFTFQVAFKGSDKVSVKFEFNSQTDTAEQVVHEMIEENVLSEKYRALVTNEINSFVKGMNPIQSSTSVDTDNSLWRSDAGLRQELSLAKKEVQMATEKALAAEKKAQQFENRINEAEKMKNESESLIKSLKLQLMEISTKKEHRDEELGSAKEYANDVSVEDLISEIAVSTNRGADKAKEWLLKLKSQDIMTVGDLRQLHEEDWASLQLTVFASRALKNCIFGIKPSTSSGQMQASVASSTNNAKAHSSVSSPRTVTSQKLDSND